MSFEPPGRPQPVVRLTEDDCQELAAELEGAACKLLEYRAKVTGQELCIGTDVPEAMRTVVNHLMRSYL